MIQYRGAALESAAETQISIRTCQLAVSIIYHKGWKHMVRRYTRPWPGQASWALGLGGCTSLGKQARYLRYVRRESEARFKVNGHEMGTCRAHALASEQKRRDPTNHGPFGILTYVRTKHGIMSIRVLDNKSQISPKGPAAPSTLLAPMPDLLTMRQLGA